MESFLQSRAWEELQKALGRATRRTDDGTLLITMPLPLGMSYDYAPRGVVRYIQPPTSNAIFLRFEPPVPDTAEAREELMKAGFKRAPDVQPSETILIDLAKSEEELLRDMEHDTRYAIRAAGKRGVVVEFSESGKGKEEFAKFWELFEATNARHGLHAYEKRYYELVAALLGDAEAEIAIAELEGSAISAAIVVNHRSTAYYLYAASRAGYGKFNAPSLLLWEIIRRAKSKNCRTLDLWGISRTMKEWAGVTAFKKSFGGRAMKFVGTWDYVYQPLRYTAYRIASRFRKKITAGR